MKRLAACLIATALLTLPAQAQERGRRGYANPGAVIAAEIAFARLAQEKGQWTAFIATATPEAEMFVPQRVLAQTWLKRRPNPPAALKWQPHAVWSSCDGSYAITQGAWQGPKGGFGQFTTVWQRQPKKGGYRWVLDIGRSLDTPLAAPEALPALVADCDGPDLPISPGLPLQAGDDSKTAVSRDGSLRWTSTVRADGSRRFVVTMRRGGGATDVVDFTATAGQ